MRKSSSSSFLKWSIWALAAIFYFYEYLLRVSPSVMIPELMTSFNITASSVGVLSACYLYAYAPMQLPVGILMDRFGVKKVLSLASIFCGIGALIFAVANTLIFAGVGRFIIGASSAFAFIAMVYVTSHWFPARKRAFLIGIANSIAMVGASSGTGPLAIIIRDFGWRSTITVFGVFGVLIGILVYLILRRDPHDVEVEEETAHSNVHILEKLKQVIAKKSDLDKCFYCAFFLYNHNSSRRTLGSSFCSVELGRF